MRAVDPAGGADLAAEATPPAARSDRPAPELPVDRGTQAARPRRRGWSVPVIALALAAAAAAGFHVWNPAGRSAVAPAAPAAAIPVTLGKATVRDLPNTRSGVGSVTPLRVVDVKARVDGQVQRLAFVEGSDVKAGDSLASIDPRPYQAQLAQAQAAYQKDTAQLVNARADNSRANRLITSGAGTVQAADTTKSQVAVLEAAIAGDQAVIDMARLNLGFAEVTAPIAGRVGLRQVDEGAIVHAGDASGIVTITQMSPIAVVFSLPQDDLPDVIAGQGQGELPVAVDSRDGSRHLADGRLTVIDSQVDGATGMIKLKAEFANDGRSLWPGELVTARVLVRTDRNATVVPSGAVQNGQTGSYVFTVKPDGTVAVAPVRTGRTVDGDTALLSGVAPGQEVVLDGQSRLTEGARVVAVTADAAPPSGNAGAPK